ncbi:ABC transporter ATP-binding protein [Streptomyces sp. NPDC056361]|uniref:ABC transporter ATP-binding protein n=1 Tax=Streptomyces sp. NPDC056361 TaxID=3345795 RepID=UPI0035DA177F
MTDTDPLIELSEVGRTYDDGPAALSDLNLRVGRGEALAVLGPSGSGKSTLLNLLAGLDRPSTGRVTVDGRRVDGMTEAASARYRRSTIGMVFQFFHLLDDLTVADNVLLPAQLAGMPRARAAGRAAELLEQLGVARHAKAHPGRLSGGERQRVAVARALMNRPPLLLADEPTGALDSASAADVRALLRELNAAGQTVVLVTHDLALAGACATRTIELVDGRIARDVTAVAR